MAKPLPFDEEAERIVLGTCCIHPELTHEMTGVLAEDDFYVQKHRWMFSAISKICDRGEVPSAALIDLQVEIDGHKRLGWKIIGDVTDESWRSIGAAKTMAKRVRELGGARRMLVKMREITDSMEDLTRDPSAWVENARIAIEEAAEVKRESKAIPMRVLIANEVANWEAKKNGAGMGIPYRFQCLNDRLLGIMPPEYVIIAARPSVGKSAIAVQLAQHWGTIEWQGKPVHTRIDVFEGTPARLTERALSQISRVDFTRVRTGNFTEADRIPLLHATRTLHNTRMDVENASYDETVLVSKWYQWRHDIGINNPAMIIGDYLQIVEPSDPKMPREQQVTKVSRAARNAAKRLNCGIIFLCQFNREVEKRGARARPQLSDLRESGSIEQDAATVIAVHRPWAVAETDEERAARQRGGPQQGAAGGAAGDRDPHYTELIVLKARDGEVGIDHLSFNGRILSFEEIDNRHRRPEDDFTPDTDR